MLLRRRHKKQNEITKTEKLNQDKKTVKMSDKKPRGHKSKEGELSE